MDWLRWGAFCAFMLTGLWVGIRLLLQTHRTAQIPELLIGVAILGLGPLGYGCAMLAWATAGEITVLSATARGCSYLAACVGAGAFYIFVSAVLRGGSRWAAVLGQLGIAALAACYAGDILERGLLNRGPAGNWYWSGLVVRLLALAWGTLECLGAWRRTRRRAALGLADPLAVSRLGLWSLGMGATLIGHAVAAGFRLAYGTSIMSHTGTSVAVMGLAIVSALAMLFAFQPPAWYVRQLGGPPEAGAVPSASS